MRIKDRIADQLPAWRERVNRLRKDHGDFKVGEVTVDQIYGGIRGVQISISDVSYVDPQQGVRLRGYTIPEVLEKLPKSAGSEYPLMGGLYYLLLTDEMPTLEEAQEVENEWKMRAMIPPHVFDVVRSMPVNTHPMTLFSQAVLAMQSSSVFARAYSEHIPKTTYWEYYLEDSMNLIANLPAIAAFIYNFKYRKGEYIPFNPRLDWSANFAHMIGKGKDAQYQELCRLFFLIHADHEGANVSAHISHLVASALSDIYLSSAAGLNGLAGPLHGLANQDCLVWLLETREKLGENIDRQTMEDYLHKLVADGGSIPGYGHAVLRVTDPRFTVQLQFAEKYMPEDELVQLVKLVFETAPVVLGENGKVKNPYPNVDAINGTLQYHYGIRQWEFYTVLFGVSRLAGLTTHAIWSRALGKPIERPKSLTTAMLEAMVAGK